MSLLIVKSFTENGGSEEYFFFLSHTVGSGASIFSFVLFVIVTSSALQFLYFLIMKAARFSCTTDYGKQKRIGSMV